MTKEFDAKTAEDYTRKIAEIHREFGIDSALLLIPTAEGLSIFIIHKPDSISKNFCNGLKNWIAANGPFCLECGAPLSEHEDDTSATRH